MGGEVWFEVATEAWLEDEERTWWLRRHCLVLSVSDTERERDRVAVSSVSSQIFFRKERLFFYKSL